VNGRLRSLFVGAAAVVVLAGAVPAAAASDSPKHLNQATATKLATVVKATLGPNATEDPSYSAPVFDGRVVRGQQRQPFIATVGYDFMVPPPGTNISVSVLEFATSSKALASLRGTAKADSSKPGNAGVTRLPNFADLAYQIAPYTTTTPDHAVTREQDPALVFVQGRYWVDVQQATDSPQTSIPQVFTPLGHALDVFLGGKG
jgi:hypothetical protein